MHPTAPGTAVEGYAHPSGWADAGQAEARAADYCRQLEAGEILVFSGAPFELPDTDCQALVAQRQAESRFHKNVSYRPHRDRVRGAAADPAAAARLHEVMRDYSRAVTAFVSDFLRPYAGRLALDFASFRPLEEEGRDLPPNRRNDLLHVDAFPTRPTAGARILRVFTNVSPEQPRVWITGEPFHLLAPRYAETAGLPRFAGQTRRPGYSLGQAARRTLRRLGWPVPPRSAYDRFMLHFHDWLKGNEAFQRDTPKVRREFPARATWLVYTDGVPHAVLSGRFALEHTYLVAREALVTPEVSPIAVLERLSGATLSV